MTTADAHAAYVAAAPAPLRPLLEDVRAALASALPDADEVMMYGMPGFAIGGTVIAGYAAFSKQCGLYVDPAAIAAHAHALTALKLKPTKTGVTFPPDRPVPDALIRDLARASREANSV